LSYHASLTPWYPSVLPHARLVLHLGLPETSMISRILCLTLSWDCGLSSNLFEFSFWGDLHFLHWPRHYLLSWPRRRVLRGCLPFHRCLSFQCLLLLLCLIKLQQRPPLKRLLAATVAGPIILMSGASR